MESLRNGTEFMTTRYTMTWVIQKKANSMPGLSSEDLLSFHTLVEEEQAESQQKQVILYLLSSESFSMLISMKATSADIYRVFHSEQILKVKVGFHYL